MSEKYYFPIRGTPILGRQADIGHSTHCGAAGVQISRPSEYIKRSAPFSSG